MRAIEVKGRGTGAETVTVSRNEIIVSLNTPDDGILAIVTIEDGVAQEPHYVRGAFQTQPDFAVTSVNYNLARLLELSEEPR